MGLSKKVYLIKAIALCAGLIAACAPPPDALNDPPSTDPRPLRIVSLDYCADQFVLKLADPAQIAAVSHDAVKPFSFMRAAAADVRRIRPSVEDAMALGPDLAVRAYGGGPNTEAFLKRLGVPVLQLGFADTIEDVRANIAQVAKALGQPERGAALIAEMDARLAIPPDPQTPQTALYLTPGGVTSGQGSLIDAIIRAAGLANFQNEPGWREIPLERLASAQPDLIAAAFFTQTHRHQDIWSAARHPLITNAMTDRPVAQLDSAWISCGGWFLVEAVERLRAVAGAGAAPS
jgi:iron complex transport system substrate-binding protein